MTKHPGWLAMVAIAVACGGAPPGTSAPVAARSLAAFDALADLQSKAADCAAAFPTIERMFEPLGAEY